MRLKSFILNEGGGSSQNKSNHRSVPIKTDWALDFLEKKCQDAINQNWKIYRGIGVSETSFYYVNPKSRGERISPYATGNYYNLFFSNAPSWSKYPKRNISLICSTEGEDAENFGDSHFVFPVDGSKIGVCPENDIWPSFKVLNSEGLDEFNWSFESLLDHIKMSWPHNWNQMVKCFDFIDDKKDEIANKIADVNMSPYEFFSETIPYFEHNTSFMEAVEDVLAPEYNNFKLVTVGDPKPSNMNSHGNEVWTDGFSILMPVHNQFIKLFEDKFGKMKDRHDQLKSEENYNKTRIMNKP